MIILRIDCMFENNTCIFFEYNETHNSYFNIYAFMQSNARVYLAIRYIRIVNLVIK